jgi:predicted metalloprotease with PDZ domain
MLGKVSGDPEFARRFFERYVEGRDAPDFPGLLAGVGLELRPRARGRAWAGPLVLEPSGRGARVTAPTAPGSPAWSAGIDEDDVIERLDGLEMTGGDVLGEVLGRHAPGDRVTVHLRRRSGPETVTLTLGADPTLELVEQPPRQRGPAQSARREAWLGSRAQ